MYILNFISWRTAWYWTFALNYNIKIALKFVFCNHSVTVSLRLEILFNCDSSLVLCPQAGPGVQHLHATLSSALLFIIISYLPSAKSWRQTSPCHSVLSSPLHLYERSFFQVLIIPSLGLPLGLFPPLWLTVEKINNWIYFSLYLSIYCTSRAPYVIHMIIPRWNFC